MNNKPLVFDFNLAKSKPNSYRQLATTKSRCPFCHPAELTEVYAQAGSMIWLHNKYPTLRKTVQTVLIETSDHDRDLISYSPAYNRKLFRFARQCFEQMRQQPQFTSVLWYKNVGPHSGGSLTHPHMQIVGLEEQNGYQYITENNFAGVAVIAAPGVEVNVATQPVQGYLEFNFNLLNEKALDQWADWIQLGAQYMLEKFANGCCDSYNLFFYPRQDNGLCAKLIARFPAPPYFVGYKLSQVDDEEKLQEEAVLLKEFLLNSPKQS